MKQDVSLSMEGEIFVNSYSKKAGILSIFFMGFGQIYNKQYVKGILLAAFELLSILFVLPFVQHGLRGLVTLGETPQTLAEGKIIQGDHSIFLMVEGVLALVIFFIFAALYRINYRDARRVGAYRDEGKPAVSFPVSLKSLWDKGFPYIMLSPSFAFILFLTVVPILFSMLIAFTDYSSPDHIPPRSLVNWVGFKTFIDLVKLPMYKTTFGGVFSWTIIWAVLSTFTSFFIGMILAVILESNHIRIKKAWRTVLILPWAVPSFVSILVMRNIFNSQFGIVNKLLSVVGIEPIPWFSDPIWAKVLCIIVNLWLACPYFMALMSGVLTGISKELYEASEVEGANKAQQFYKITFPLVMFSTAPLLIMSFANNFNNFGLIYFLTNGNPVNMDYQYAGSTDILLSWMYKMTLEYSQFNKASAVSILIFIVLAVISIFNFRNTWAYKEEDMVQ